MEESDLRLGNLLFDKDNNIEVVYRLHQFAEGTQINDTYIESYRPIPLDEKWLLKFSFVNSEYDGSKYNSDNVFAEQFQYILESGVFNRPLICKPHQGWIVRLGDYESKVEIKYVHQLQNLYFALTGKELTLKE